MLRLIAKDVEDFAFVRRQSFLFLGWVLLAASVAIYSAVITADRIGQGKTTLNLVLLFAISLGLYGFSVIFSFVVALIDAQRIPTTNVRAVALLAEEKLAEDFDKSVDTAEPGQAVALPEDLEEGTGEDSEDRKEED